MTIDIDEQELALILQGLYYIEDLHWFFQNKKEVEDLIGKLDKIAEFNTVDKHPICDI